MCGLSRRMVSTALCGAARRRDRRAAQFGGHGLGPVILEVDLEVGHEVDVGIAAEDDAAPHVVVAQEAHQRAPRYRVTIPCVGPHPPAAVDDDARPRHLRRLGDEVPASRRGGQTRPEPTDLRAAEHRAIGLDELWAALVDHGRSAPPGRRARLRRAVLTAVEHVKAGQPAPVEPAVQTRMGEVDVRGGAQRHVLEIGLVSRGPATQEVRAEPLRLPAGIVVVDLVVIPRHQPRHRGVQALQVGVGLVLRVPVAVLRQRRHLVPDVLPDTIGPSPALVEVVAQEQHEVDVLGQRVPVRPEIADLEVLARRERVAQLPRIRCGGRSGARPACRALPVPGPETVEVPPSWLQPADVDVRAVRSLRHRIHAPPPCDPAKPLIGRDLPVDRHHAVADTAAVQRSRSEPRPDDHGGRKRRSRCDPERERVPGEAHPLATRTASGWVSR